MRFPSINTKYIFLGLLVLGLFVAIYYHFHPLVPRLRIGSSIFTYEIAVTPEQITQGLSGRNPLAENHGMLFVFDHEEQYKFWMKDMKFSLDLLWIKDKTVVDISKNVPHPQRPTDELPMYSPKQAVNRVLEVNAGTADRLGIKEGDNVEYLKK